MSLFEEALINGFIRANQILVWRRYIDDIFVVVPGHMCLEELKIKLNGWHPSLKFTLEVAKDNKLPFLDLMVGWDVSQRVNLGIYIKETGHPSYQAWDSDKPEVNRLAGLRSLLYRMFAFPITREARAQEAQRLRNIAQDCHLPCQVWGREIKRSLRNVAIRNSISTLKPHRPRPEGVPVRIPWQQGKWRTITAGLKKNGYYPVWVGGASIQDFLPRYKGPAREPRPPRMQGIPEQLIRGGVYSLNCSQCPANYIGQTKNFFNRLGQHMGDLRNQRAHGALVPHSREEHRFRGFNRVSPPNNDYVMIPVVECNDPATVNFLETVAIRQNRANILNREEGPVANDFTRVAARLINLPLHGAKVGLVATPTGTRNNISVQQLIEPGASFGNLANRPEQIHDAEDG
jgi:hypothetical protein